MIHLTLLAVLLMILLFGLIAEIEGGHVRTGQEPEREDERR
ncbi:hypothetical protein [Limimaricola sp.]|nr:hypothetical protein [Limimaricola sp.]